MKICASIAPPSQSPETLYATTDELQMLTLSKQIFNQVHREGAIRQTVFSLFDNQETLGKLMLSRNERSISTPTSHLEVNSFNEIVGIEPEETLGKFNLTEWTIFKGYTDSFNFRGKQFRLKKVRPDTKHSIFKKATWGQFKFELYADDHNKCAYIFRIPTPALALGNPYIDKEFFGEIENNKLNNEEILLGCFLLERAIENEVLPG